MTEACKSEYNNINLWFPFVAGATVRTAVLENESTLSKSIRFNSTGV